MSFGRVEEARKWFRLSYDMECRGAAWAHKESSSFKLPKPSAFVDNVYINGLARNGLLDEAISEFRRLYSSSASTEEDVVGRIQALTSITHWSFRHRDGSLAEYCAKHTLELHREARQLKLLDPIVLYNVLIGGYARSGEYTSMWSVIHRMAVTPDSTTFISVIQELVGNSPSEYRECIGNIEKVYLYFKNELGVRLSRRGYVILLVRGCNAILPEEVYYGNRSHLKFLEMVWTDYKRQSGRYLVLKACQSVSGLFLKNRDHCGALSVLEDMISGGAKPNQAILIRLLDYCSRWHGWICAVGVANKLWLAAKRQGWIYLRQDLIVIVLAFYGRGAKHSVDPGARRRKFFERLVRSSNGERTYTIDESLYNERGVSKYWKLVNEMPGYEKELSWNNQSDSTWISRRTNREVSTWSGDFHGPPPPVASLPRLLECFEFPMDYGKLVAPPDPRMTFYSFSHRIFVHLLLMHCDYNDFGSCSLQIIKDYQIYDDWTYIIGKGKDMRNVHVEKLFA